MLKNIPVMSALLSLMCFSFVLAQSVNFPARSTPIPPTTDSVPHVQLGVIPDRTISTALLERVSKLPGVDIRDTVISLPGAYGFWLSETITLANPQAIVGGREFAHVHPDGSLHASLPPSLAVQAVEAGWATPHPWAAERPGWEGFVMIYTPMSDAELAVVFDLVVSAYNFVTGRTVAL